MPAAGSFGISRCDFICTLSSGSSLRIRGHIGSAGEYNAVQSVSEMIIPSMVSTGGMIEAWRDSTTDIQ